MLTSRSGCDLGPPTYRPDGGSSDLGGGGIGAGIGAGGTTGSGVPGAWEWKLTLRVEGQATFGPFGGYATSVVDGGRGLIPRLVVESRDAASDIPPLLIQGELPGAELSISASPPTTKPGGGEVAPPAGFGVLPPPAELFHVLLRSARVRWASLGGRHGWRLRMRSQLAIDAHDFDDLSRSVLLRETDVHFTIGSGASATQPSLPLPPRPYAQHAEPYKIGA